jgi:hypothetical protein
MTLHIICDGKDDNRDIQIALDELDNPDREVVIVEASK